MATNKNTESDSKVKKLIVQFELAERLRDTNPIDIPYQYRKRIIEIKSIDIKGISLVGLEELRERLESEMNALDSEETSKLPERKRASIKCQYATIIERYANVIRQVHLLNVKLDKFTLKALIYKREEATFGGQITKARKEMNEQLEELKSNPSIDSDYKQVLISRYETELLRLDKEVINQFLSQVPQEIRASIKDEYITNVEQCIIIAKCYELRAELTEMKAPVYKSQEANFERQIYTARHDLEELKSNETIDSYHKQDVILKIDTELERLDKEVTDQFINVEVRDSIDLIEKTLAEPHLHSLPHLIMWRNTAQEKIERIKNFPKPIPQEIVKEKIERYEFLIKQLRAEILKLRTYPIPEPWYSHCMRKGLTHKIKGEFIFFVHPGIEADIRPLKLYDRDILPGGLTCQEYDSRMNRMNRESTKAIEELEAGSARKMERKLKWIEDSFAEIEKDLNFTLTELPLLHRDGRTLEYLVDRNQDDELLQEIYNTLLRRLRHFYNNRINIPSVVIDWINEPMLVAPPKTERNIPIASGVDRGATEGIQLVTPASVVVYKNTVFVADKYGHLISWYRDSDLAAIGSFLEAIGSYHHTTADSPVSLTVCNNSLYVCYINELMQFSLSWDNSFEVTNLEIETSIEIPQICCTATNGDKLFVGTLKPSLIIMYTYDLRIKHEYKLNPIRHQKRKRSRYPWLQDIKATNYSIICLFTGSPSPLQMFSFEGKPLAPILTKDNIVGAYHFNLIFNPVIRQWVIYITDFWDNAIKAFDLKGRFIETFSEKGFGLGQIFQPTGIFVEESGFITVCDMKKDNCLQRL